MKKPRINLPSEEIKRKYLEDKIGLVKLGEEYGLSWSPIKNLLEREGVKLRNNSEAHGGKVLPIDEIINKYVNEVSNTTELSREYDVSISVIYRLLKSANVKLRDNREAQIGSKKISDIINLLKETSLNFTEISDKVNISNITISKIQDKAICEGLLNEKYRRLGSGTIQYQKDDVLKLLKETDFSQSEISKKVGLSGATIKHIQDNAIKDGILDEKYKRILGGSIQYKKDESIELLKRTDLSLNKIAERLDLSYSAMGRIQDKAIKEGILDKKCRRLVGGSIIQSQKDEAIKLLEETVLNLSEIGDKVGLNNETISTIQNQAIKNKALNEKYRRLKGGIVQYQKDEVLSILKGTKFKYYEIRDLTGLSITSVRNIQNSAIEEGLLDKKYRRTKNRRYSLEQQLKIYAGAGK
jgi:DNA-directed RNA polymerase specialized sigma subunit